MKQSNRSEGFALPTVMVASVVMLIVMLSAVVSTVAIRASLKTQYFNRLAQSAGEAGVAYAKACLSQNGNIAQWSDAKPLGPNTDCSGNEAVVCNDSNVMTEPRCSVFVSDKSVFSFSVKGTVNDAGGKAVSANSVGTARLYRGNGTNAEVWRQYSDSVLLYNMPKTSITAIGAITGTAQIGQTLTAGAVTPAGATVSYQWFSSATSGGAYDVIAGATASTYVVSPSVMGKYIKVTATGTGVYSGTQTSAATGQVPSDTTNWITIGAQTWAKANLNVGTRIAGASNQTNNAITEKYCYNDAENSCTIHGGALYQWDEAMGYATTEGAQGICPAGSHIPSDNEWKTLEMSLGMTQIQADATGTRGTNQGGQMLSSVELNVPLAGVRVIDGSAFLAVEQNAYLWSSTESATNAWYRSIYMEGLGVYRNMSAKTAGFSVRCLGN